MKGSIKKTCKGCGDTLYGRLDNDDTYYFSCSVCGSMWTKAKGWMILKGKDKVMRLHKKRGVKNKTQAEMNKRNEQIFVKD